MEVERRTSNTPQEDVLRVIKILIGRKKSLLSKKLAASTSGVLLSPRSICEMKLCENQPESAATGSVGI